MRSSIRYLQIGLVSISLLLFGCNPSTHPPETWRSGKLVVIIPELNSSAEAEFQKELAGLFADSIHSQLELLAVPQEDVQSALLKHKAHFAAVSFRTGVPEASVQFGSVYQTVREQIVCNSDYPLPKELGDFLTRKLIVIAGSAEEVASTEAIKKTPTIQLQIQHKLTIDKLLARVSEGNLFCAVANELQFADSRNYHPNLASTMDIAPPSRLAWGFPEDVDSELVKQVEQFFKGIKKDGTLNRLLDRYYGHNNRLTKVDATAFISATNTVLPHYRQMFEEAAAVSGEEWQLLAALAYQESQWDPFATSMTNVRGMMMLTAETADRMNLENRLDARENIIAGAKYLGLLKEQMPEHIKEPDRTWLALAAYNQGFGHMEDARILTSRAKQNPDSWSDVKKWMMQLNQQGIYESLKYGYARGGEAVVLVENIRIYSEMLKKLAPETVIDPYKLPKSIKGLLH